MKVRPLRFALPAALTFFAASACSLFSQTIPGEDLAEAAADAIEAQIGVRPEVDCGTEDITPEKGKEVDCTVADVDDGQELDAVVTFTGVDGDQWDIEVEVLPAADAEDEPTQDEAPTEPAGEETEDSAAAPTGGEISAEALATAAEDALESEAGQRPEVDCGEVNYIPDNGRTVYCTLTDPSTGLEYSTTVTFTGVDGDRWSIQVEVADQPN